MQISIIACGWLGLPLGEYLAFKGHKVKGSTTKFSKILKLENAGIEPFVLNLDPEINCENFNELVDSELIIINIPPRIAKKGADFHIDQIKNLIKGIKENTSVNSVPPCDPNEKLSVNSVPLCNPNEKLSVHSMSPCGNSPKIIFISSTSVYPEANQIATENSVVDENSVLIKAENLLKDSFEKVTILRCGGLMGYDRQPGKYYAGKPFDNWASGVNYIHQDDALLIINQIIDHDIWNETFNICSPVHTSRKEIIAKNCEDLGLELPFFTEPQKPIPFKIISPEKLINTLNYQFKYPNPLDYFYSPSYG